MTPEHGDDGTRDVKVMLWTGGDAPHRDAAIAVNYCDNRREFFAYWSPGFCGCEDCRPLMGYGATEQEAVADYWERWEGKHGPTK